MVFRGANTRREEGKKEPRTPLMSTGLIFIIFQGLSHPGGTLLLAEEPVVMLKDR